MIFEWFYVCGVFLTVLFGSNIIYAMAIRYTLHPINFIMAAIGAAMIVCGTLN